MTNVGISAGMRITETMKRKRELMRTPHTFYNDPGHAWLEVQISDLKLLGIDKKISGYSYRNEELAYLEEDQDAGTYLNAIFPDALNNQEFRQFRDMYILDKYVENNIFVRSLRHY
jgi:CTP:phosphocholine cytidylyltransferase-like protein